MNNTTRSLVSAMVLTIACPLGLARSAQAQQSPPTGGERGRLQLSGSLGYNGQWDDESRLGQGAGVSGGVGYRLTRRLWIEATMTRLEHTRALLFYQVSEGPIGLTATPYPATLTGSATYVLAQVRYVFSTSRVQPYVAGAFGAMRYSGNGWGATFPPQAGASPQAGGVSATSLARGFSGGLDVVVARQISVGPYLGMLVSDNDEAGTKTALHGGVRVAFTW